MSVKSVDDGAAENDIIILDERLVVSKMGGMNNYLIQLMAFILRNYLIYKYYKSV